MNIHDFRIFDKKGSYINWYRDSYIQVDFTTDTTNAVPAEAFAITDPSGFITDVIIEKSGFNYNTANTTALLTYTFEPTGQSTILTSADVSINFKDVSIFSPDPLNVYGIASAVIDSSISYIYPSVSYSGALFLNTVSKGLVETEHLTILENDPCTGAYIRPYDPSSSLIFRFVGEDSEIKLFELDTNSQEIVWSDEVTFSTNIIAQNIPITVNIGFKADEEGVYERRLRAYELRDGAEYILAEFLVNAQAIPQDERFDTLLQNFAPSLNPKEFPHLFKEADINEDNPDWKLINQKSKNAILDYSNIIPYIGTYKALINSIKWLGYDDLKIKEWFRDVKNSKKISLDIPYNARERTKTILQFSAEERKNLKKLNELSLIYQINRETGEIDEWGTPIVENVYEYNIKEILIKLSSLKEWLEKNIIGVNARITDITGEAVYYERFKNLIYGVQKHSIDAMFYQKISPITIDNNSELIEGDASIRLSLLELQKTKIKDFNYTFRSLISYGYTHDASLDSDGMYEVINVDSSIINDFDASIVRVSPTFKFPFKDLTDIMWSATSKYKSAGVLGTEFVTNPLFIYENQIRYYDNIQEDSTFFDTSTNLSIVIQRAYLRDASNDIWDASQIMYEIYADPSGNYIMESSTGTITSFTNFVTLNVLKDGSSSLTFNVDQNWKVPLLKFKNYSITDSSNNYSIFEYGKEFILDMNEGKIILDVSILNSHNNPLYTTYAINFNNDEDLTNKSITLNTKYSSGRIPLYQYDPSIYYYYQEELDSNPIPSLVIDNSIYDLEVNHIGNYAIDIYSWDSWNTTYYNKYYSKEGDSSTYEVWTKYPVLSAIVESSTAGSDPSIYSTSIVNTNINDNLVPVFDRQIHLQNLSVKIDSSGNQYLEIPSVTFFQDLPEVGSISKYFNLTERVSTIISNNEFSVDFDFMNFKLNDSINAILFDKNKYEAIYQIDASIISITDNGTYIDVSLNISLPSYWLSDVSTQIYFRNITERQINRVIGDPSIQYETSSTPAYMTINVSDYTFLEDQLVAFLIRDLSTGYSMGAAYKVVDSSTTLSANGYAHTFEGRISDYILADASRYTISVKHTFDQYFSTQLDILEAYNISDNFLLYNDDPYYVQNYIDNTFTYVNLPFDQEEVLRQWGENSQYNALGFYYSYNKYINIDVSSLVVLDAVYNDANYMLNQRNVWTIRDTSTNKLKMKVWNNQLVYVFDEIGQFNVKGEAYDSYGNLRTQIFDGMITVI